MQATGHLSRWRPLKFEHVGHDEEWRDFMKANVYLLHYCLNFLYIIPLDRKAFHMIPEVQFCGGGLRYLSSWGQQNNKT